MQCDSFLNSGIEASILYPSLLDGCLSTDSDLKLDWHMTLAMYGFKILESLTLSIAVKVQ